MAARSSERYPQILKRASRHAFATAEDPKEQVVAADARVPERLAFLAREPDDAAGTGAEHRDGRARVPAARCLRRLALQAASVPPVGALPADAERLGDSAPRQTRPDRLFDVVGFEPVEATTQLGDGPQPFNRIVRLGGALREVQQSHRWDGWFRDHQRVKHR